MLTRLDHLVILVLDLERASADFERLGFAVTPGGEHADGLTRNALVPFEDGTYLELVSFLDPEDPADNVWGWRGFLPQEGLIDYCATSDDLDAEARRLAPLGFGVHGPDDGGRRLPDGTDLRWRSARIRQEGRTFPFLIEDLTPPQTARPRRPRNQAPERRDRRLPARNLRPRPGRSSGLPRRPDGHRDSCAARRLRALAGYGARRTSDVTRPFGRGVGRRGARDSAGAGSRSRPRCLHPVAVRVDPATPLLVKPMPRQGPTSQEVSSAQIPKPETCSPAREASRTRAG